MAWKNSVLPHLQKHFLAYILLALLILFNIPTFSGLIDDWAHDGNYSHGFLIIPISLFLLFQKRNELLFPAQTNRLGILLFLIGCLGLIFGAAASELFSTRLSIVIVITGLALHYLGTANFKKVWFAFFFLLFMIPPPATIYYSFTMPMQLFSSKMTGNLLHFAGVVCHREGNIIFLPGYALEVTEACSGLRSLVTLMALSALFGYLILPGKVRPTILFFSAIPIAIVVNVLRLIVTAIEAYAISPKLAENFLHELSGILVFIVALICILLIAGLLRWKKNPL
jgi:exosortase